MEDGIFFGKDWIGCLTAFKYEQVLLHTLAMNGLEITCCYCHG